MQCNPIEYELLDFGAGRKLERFGAVVVDRPCPAAEAAVSQPHLWTRAALRYERPSGSSGKWVTIADAPREWTIQCGTLRLSLRPTASGQVGLFPEQAPLWTWIGERVREAGRPIRVLNLFAYTGGATLAAAAAGAHVVHVDGARSAIAWARENARLSGLEAAPIRWITEDCLTFVRRELNRKRQYHAVILDPPSYGHGPAGETWVLDLQLAELIALCGRITAEDRRFVLLTCHTNGFDPSELARLLGQHVDSTLIEAGELALVSQSGRSLPCGAMARSSIARPSAAGEKPPAARQPRNTTGADPAWRN